MSNYDGIPTSIRADLEMLTPDQVCDLLQVKKDWLYDAVEKHGFPHFRLGRQLRFRPREVASWVAEQRVPRP